MKRALAYVLLFTLPLLSACNTIEGLGQDIKKGGEKLEEAADKNK